jgi:ABC-type dipeptide/oligopeptide/nickel transport system ATPase subunit
MMQGGCVNHIALKAADGTGERITMVTSLRAKDPMQKDVLNLTNVKRSSKLNELFQQWSAYRLDIIADRALIMKKEIVESNKSAEEISKSMAQWYEKQVEYLKTAVEEMRGSGREGSQF